MLKLSNLESIGKPVYKFHNLHSVDFDGVDDFIQLGEPISYTQHTISTWVKITNSGSSKTIFDSRDSANDGIRLRTDSSENIIYRVNDSALTSTNSYVDEWVHIVGTYDGTTQKLYINGSLDQSATTTQEVSVTTNAKIGARNFDDRALEFLGKIDELAIFDRALEEEEVTKIYRIKYGANLVQNGRFDELGSELVTNGDFATDSDWNNNVGNDWQISNGKLILTTTSSNNVNQAIGLVQNKLYKIVFTISNTTSGGVRVRLGTGSFTSVFTDGTHTLYLEQTTTNDAFRFYANSSGVFNGQIDNVSVKQVDPNDRFTLGTGFSFGDEKMIATEATGNLLQTNVFTIGKTYKITFTINEVTAGNGVRVLCGTTNGTVRTTAGTYSQILTCAGSAHLFVDPNISFTGSISNLMAEEQKYVATNLKLNSIPYSSSNLRNYYRMGDGILDTHPLICDMVEPSLGSELVTNGDFLLNPINLNGWFENFFPSGNVLAGSAWTWDSSTYIVTGGIQQGGSNSESQLFQNYTATVGRTYKFEALVKSTNDKARLHVFTGSPGGSFPGSNFHSGSGEFEKLSICFVATGNAGSTTTVTLRLQLTAVTSGTETFTAQYKNATFKEVNGVPALMTNMTEADITNDVPS
tara:strand:+ start:178 stop:2091 length:1914 start_codon:yes stop_codon:yes gene_type:complete